MQTKRIGISFIYNAGSSLFLLAVSLFTVPLYLRYIGEARYGVLSIAWVLLGYFGFLDLGLSRASANALAKLSPRQRDDRQKIIVTTLCINVGLGLLGGILLWLAGAFLLDKFLTVPADLRSEISSTFPWVSVLIPLALASGIGTGVLEARERFLTANILQLAGLVAGQLVPVACGILIAPNLYVVLPAAILCRAGAVLLILGFVAYEEWPLSIRAFDKTQAKTLLSYGGWVSVSSIVSPVLVSLDQVVIGSILSVASVAYYAVATNLVSRSQLFAAALSRALFPRLSRISSEDARSLSERAFVTLSFFYGAICVPAIVLVDPFMKLWIGEAFATVAGPIAAVLLVGGWLNGLAFIPFSFIQAQGRPIVTAKFHLLEFIPFVLILLALTSFFGIIGAAIATVARSATDACLLLAASRFKASHIWPTIFPFAALIFAYLLRMLPINNSLDWLVVGSSLGLGILCLGIALDPNIRKMLSRLRLSALF